MGFALSDIKGRSMRVVGHLGMQKHRSLRNFVTIADLIDGDIAINSVESECTKRILAKSRPPNTNAILW